MDILKNYWFVIIVCIYIFIKSSPSHKKGYFVFLIWIISREFSFGKNFELFIEKYEILYTVYFYMCWVLKIYCIIGIVEAAIRVFSKQFTFSGWFKKYILHHEDKEKDDKPDVEELHDDQKINVEENTTEQKQSVQSDANQGTGGQSKPPLKSNLSQDGKDQNEQTSKLSEYCMNHIFMISRRKRFWDSDIEMKAYSALRSFIDNAYIILPHVAFREIFYWGKWESNWKLTDRVTKMHFDFGIYNDNLQPILFIEIYGKQHYDNPEVMERDKFKAELMKKCDLKMIAIDFSGTIADNEIVDKLIQCIKEEVPDRNAYPVYCPKCNSLMKIKRNNSTNEYFYGCTTYKKGSSDNCPTINIKDVPPLYSGMQ